MNIIIYHVHVSTHYHAQSVRKNCTLGESCKVGVEYLVVVVALEGYTNENIRIMNSWLCFWRLSSISSIFFSNFM